MKALLLAAILTCACCGGPPAQGQTNDLEQFRSDLRVALEAQPPAPQEEAEPEYFVMTARVYNQVLTVIRTMTAAIEHQKTEIERLQEKLKGACP